ncbi:hypothetical protein D3C75_1091620 [compost metagenome]
MLFDEGAGIGIQHIGIGQQCIVVIVDQVGSSVEGKQIVHRGRQLECSFIAVALDTVDPLRVDRPRAYHAVELFL